MDPQIALQLFLTIAKISGTMLAIFLAIVIFALRDKDVARLFLTKKQYHYAPLIAVFACAFLFGLMIMSSLFNALDVNLEVPFDESIVRGNFSFFYPSLYFLSYSILPYSYSIIIHRW